MNEFNEMSKPEVEEECEILKRPNKRTGRPTDKSPSKKALRQRAYRARLKREGITPEVALQRKIEKEERMEQRIQELELDRKVQYTSISLAEKLVKRSMTELAPARATFDAEVMAEAQAQARISMKIMAAAIPQITQAVIQGAMERDPTCLSIASKWLHNPSQHTTLDMPKGLTVEESATHIVGSALQGHLSLKQASEGLDLIEQHSAITLNASLVARIDALKSMLDDLRLDATKQRVVSIEQVAPSSLTLDENGNLIQREDK